MMKIRQKDKNRLEEIFKQCLGEAAEVWTYGSRVNGDAHDGSDIDLVVRKHDLKAIDINTYMELKELIRESNIPVMVDLHDWGRLPESFHKNILSNYEVLFTQNKSDGG